MAHIRYINDKKIIYIYIYICVYLFVYKNLFEVETVILAMVPHCHVRPWRPYQYVTNATGNDLSEILASQALHLLMTYGMNNMMLKVQDES